MIFKDSISQRNWVCLYETNRRNRVIECLYDTCSFFFYFTFTALCILKWYGLSPKVNNAPKHQLSFAIHTPYNPLHWSQLETEVNWRTDDFYFQLASALTAICVHAALAAMLRSEGNCSEMKGGWLRFQTDLGSVGYTGWVQFSRAFISVNRTDSGTDSATPTQTLVSSEVGCVICHSYPLF